MFILWETKHYWKVTAFILMCVCLTNSSKCYTNTKWVFLLCYSQATLYQRFSNRNPPSNQWGIRKVLMPCYGTWGYFEYKAKRYVKKKGTFLLEALLKSLSSFKSTSFYQLLADFRDHLSSSHVILGRISRFVPHCLDSHLMKIWMDFLWSLNIFCFHWDWTHQLVSTALCVAKS